MAAKKGKQLTYFFSLKFWENPQEKEVFTREYGFLRRNQKAKGLMKLCQASNIRFKSCSNKQQLEGSQSQAVHCLKFRL